MKTEKWDKKTLVGSELRGKTLGIVGFGRIGHEVAVRARAFGMRIVAHDPFIARDIAERLDVELLPLDDVCAAADYLTLHLPSTPETKHLFNSARFARCKRGIRLVNTARGELVDEAALRAALDEGLVGAAALDVFETEPPRDWSLAKHPRVIATPHIAASTEEAQELVGRETAASVRDYLRDGVVRSAVNLPAGAADAMQRLQPWIRLADRLGLLLSHLGPARASSLGVRCYGALAEDPAADLLAASAAAGMLRPILSAGVSIVNARAVAGARGIDIVASRSSRPRHYASMVSVKLETDGGERWAEGTVFEPQALRLTSLDGVVVEAPLAGTILVIRNDDRPGVIGEVGTILGRHRVNIANFALGRRDAGAVGVVNLDETRGDSGLADALAEIRRAPGIRDASIVRLGEPARG
jgi:D-3-phosphoglycerate dehydrogenase